MAQRSGAATGGANGTHDNINKVEAIEPITPARIPYMRKVFDQAGITPEVANFPFRGAGTEEDPYLVEWLPNDPRNPMTWSASTRWFVTMLAACTTLAVTLVSSAFASGIQEIMAEFHCSQEIATLGVSLFVLGFAIGPLLWAPLSELFGRQALFIGTYAALTAFNAGCAGSQNIWTVIILRFFAGSFGSSALTNAGGVIADMFPAAQRGVALALFAAAPFLGPVLGPVIGGFLGMNAGWRWVLGFLAAFSGVFWILGSLFVPETYAPVLLRSRATKLSKTTGKVYVSKLDSDRGKVSLTVALKTSLSRPWVLLFTEPIVLLLSIYMAIIYGTLYMMFGAFPIVYEVNRHWNQGIAGLPFLGIMVGMFFAVAYAIYTNKRYIKVQEENDGFAPPEARLPPTLVGCIALPIGLFWFAWTNYASVHWIVSIIACVPFGFGMVLVFLSIMNYLIDAYTIFAASVLAANSVIRSCFGAAFPLFTTYMYNNLGIHWASTIPAFLALACVPFPFLFYKYGAGIREKCKFAAESAAFIRKLAAAQATEPEPGEETEKTEADSNGLMEDDGEGPEDDPYFAPITGSRSRDSAHGHGGLSRTGTGMSRASRASRASVRSGYEGNPFDLDRVNTKNSFSGHPDDNRSVKSRH